MKHNDVNEALRLCNRLLEDIEYVPDVYSEIAKDIGSFIVMIKNSIQKTKQVTERQMVALKLYKRNLSRILKNSY